jgi:hypothetical protein
MGTIIPIISWIFKKIKSINGFMCWHALCNYTGASLKSTPLLLTPSQYIDFIF